MTLFQRVQQKRKGLALPSKRSKVKAARDNAKRNLKARRGLVAPLKKLSKSEDTKGVSSKSVHMNKKKGVQMGKKGRKRF